MADRPISELTPVTTVTSSDNFVLEQSNRAMRLTGQTLLNWLAREMDAHGGIRNVAKTSTSGLTDTYTITYADETTTTFTITNGRSITGLTKTGTQTLVDTYTITFNDNTSFNFAVTNGKGISDLSKTGTTGLVDTYTITFNDNTSLDFDVTNGNGIESFSKTGTSGLVDTYTIEFTDGTSFAIDVTNGNGISSVTKSSTSGLIDTYTITFTNGTTTNFSVDNGRGINSIEKTSTSGLADTYTIHYNDGTDSSFIVMNGEKGDNTYTWVKYSAVQPTSDSDMTDNPSDWFGLYTGSASTAPTTYTSYSWYRIRGDKGDTGDDLTVQTTNIMYGASTAENVMPSEWTTTMPQVAQGSFLWTRAILQFINGAESAPIYLKARMGMDGLGSVSTVNHISPDELGNVQLTQYEFLTVNELMGL